MKMRWGDICSLEYGKGIRNCPEEPSDTDRYRVFGTNGPIGWTSEPLTSGPGVIVGRKGAYRGVHFSAEPFFVIDTAYYLRLKDSSVDMKWAYYNLLTVDINRIDVGAAIPTTNRDSFYAVPVHVPPIEKQQRIASVSSTYDDLLENNLRRIKLLEESARQLYKKWFVRLKFSGYKHVKIKNGLPEGWVKKKLKDVADMNHSTIGNSYGGEIEYVDISSVTPGQINNTTKHEFKAAPSRARRIATHGDVIWSCVRPNRRSHAVIWRPPENLIVSTGFAVLTPREIPTSYFYQHVTTDIFVGYLENRAQGVAYPAVKATDFEEADIVLPSSGVLRGFDELVKPIIEQIHGLRIQSQKLREARDILLPKLMSGELDV